MNQSTYFILAASLIAIGGLGIAQLWFSFLTSEVFFKILITAGIVFGVIGLLKILKSDFMTRKQLKDENYLD